MHKIQYLRPLPKEHFLKISILKFLMYTGSLWGLYYNGWAMTSDQDDHIFPFWLTSLQAKKYSKKYWPNYSPRKITPENFQQALLPTLNRLNALPTLYHTGQRFKLSCHQMAYLFFNQPQTV
ncbi:DUF2750 domain-containing protein [Acinetobacter equi]|uniref:DUF2750 domain-containing protein n=1 Tax=Acinetobacter equi TaxID=1324350 RepID=A0A0N9W488_9GAMM|nr:DUF2750 domain-containing protein [Acinetobacter equi]ALH95935.1 hypothetical protein AOY20_10540 [Acinetobacter equi]